MVVLDLALAVVAIALTGDWASPFILMPLPTVLLAAYGWGYREGLATAALTGATIALADAIAGRRRGRAAHRDPRVGRRACSPRSSVASPASSGSRPSAVSRRRSTRSPAWRSPTTCSTRCTTSCRRSRRRSTSARSSRPRSETFRELVDSTVAVVLVPDDTSDVVARRARRRRAPPGDARDPTTCRATLQEALRPHGVVRVRRPSSPAPAPRAAPSRQQRHRHGAARPRPRRRARRRSSTATPTRTPTRTRALRRARVVARARGRQRPLVLAAAHPRRRGRAGPHRPRPARQRRPVARLRRLRARPAAQPLQRRPGAARAAAGRPGGRGRAARDALPAPDDGQRERGSGRRRREYIKRWSHRTGVDAEFDADTAGSSRAAARWSRSCGGSSRKRSRTSSDMPMPLTHGSAGGLVDGRRAARGSRRRARHGHRRPYPASATVSSASANVPMRSVPRSGSMSEPRERVPPCSSNWRQPQ